MKTHLTARLAYIETQGRGRVIFYLLILSLTRRLCIPVEKCKFVNTTTFYRLCTYRKLAVITAKRKTGVGAEFVFKNPTANDSTRLKGIQYYTEKVTKNKLQSARSKI